MWYTYVFACKSSQNQERFHIVEGVAIMNKIIRSLLYVVIGLIAEICLISVLSPKNDSAKDGAMVLKNFESTMLTFLVIIVFTFLLPIVLSLLKDFKPVAFLLKTPIELCLIVLLGFKKNNTPMEYYTTLFISGLALFLSVASFGLSVATIKIKNIITDRISKK